MANKQPGRPNTATSDSTYRRHRRRYRAACEAAEAPCHLCGQGISYLPNSPDPWELDHFYPRSTHPELHLDPANWRPAHSSCNRSRGTDEVSPSLGVPSEDW